MRWMLLRPERHRGWVAFEAPATKSSVPGCQLMTPG